MNKINKSKLQIREERATHKDKFFKLLSEESNSNSVTITERFLSQVGNACNPRMNMMETLENIRAVEPRDHVERMLAVQMIATHNTLMRCFKRSASLLDREDFQLINLGHDTLKLVDKLARTYTMQMETLNRYRNKGKQKMTIEHVHINSGAQAIIGNVETNKQP